MVNVLTSPLYSQALVGTHSLLGDFKVLHRALEVKKVQAEEPPDQRFFKLIQRALDVKKKVQAEVRHAELENIRLRPAQ